MAKNILIIDDAQDIVKALSIRLKAHRYEVITAFDGQKGLDMARSRRPDLIILDLSLPKLDGYKVCQNLKNDPQYKHIPIIMFTAKQGAEDEVLGLEMGAEEYVNKPFEPEELMEKIKKYIG